MNTKREVFWERLDQYLAASKQEKGKIIDAVAIITGMHRKAVIRGFGREQMRSRFNPRKKSGPFVSYTNDVTVALKEIWSAGNEVCAELLHPVVSEYITIDITSQDWTQIWYNTGNEESKTDLFSI
jgi:hypothetical protein